jgi:hypothetical protein
MRKIRMNVWTGEPKTLLPASHIMCEAPCSELVAPMEGLHADQPLSYYY